MLLLASGDDGADDVKDAGCDGSIRRPQLMIVEVAAAVVSIQRLFSFQVRFALASPMWRKHSRRGYRPLIDFGI